MPRPAIGLLHLGYPDQLTTARTVIANLAKRHDYTIVGYAELDFDTYLPATHIISTAAHARAAVIIAADLDHFGTAYRTVPRVCPVLLPTGLLPGPATTAYTTRTTPEDG